ncbi:MAG: hypothetical protein ACYC7E_22860 [Armatimonadota bacterium]
MTSTTDQEFPALKRTVIPGLRTVDWSDAARQNEFLNSAISAMESFGKQYDYDDLACISGCAFRGCAPLRGIHPGVYQVTNDMAIIGHTFNMLGYQVTLHPRSDYETDKKLIMDSIDNGVPALTFGGVVSCAECCIISGYDDDGAVLLGYSPFMDVQEDHTEPADSTGYFRKSNWHDGYFQKSNGKILIFSEPTASLSADEIIRESLNMAVKLIRGTASQRSDVMTGYAGHTRYAELVCQETDDWFLLNLMIVCMNCNVYQDKVYVAPYLRKAKHVLKDKAAVLEAGATLYDYIADVRREMTNYVADDLSTGKRILDKEIRKQYAQCVYKIRDLEKCAADLFEKI